MNDHQEILSYKDAMNELSQLLTALEEDSSDLDQLAEKVERAAHLIQYCRSKIRHTEMRIKSIIDQIDEP